MSGIEPFAASGPSADRSHAVERAYAEYYQLREAGELVDPEAFCARHPGLQSSLRRQLEVDAYLEAHPELLAEWRRADWPQPGQTFLGFSLLRELGRGGFARVFLAAEPAMGGRRVAVKVSFQGAAEAQTLGRLNHPHIVPVNSIKADEQTGLTAVCMPFLGSATLADVLDRVTATPNQPASARVFLDAIAAASAVCEVAPTDRKKAELFWRGKYVDAVLQLGVALAEALAYAHGLGVCHRDLKPSNVLLVADGRPMVLDFNLCADETRADDRLGGTLPYMAPEQLLAVDPSLADAPAVGPSADLFALGLLLYELLEGRHPFGPIPPRAPIWEFRAELLRRQQAGPAALRRTRGVDGVVARVIGRCLAFDPSDRPKSAAALAAELRRMSSWLGRVRRWVANHRRVVSAGAFASVLAGTLGVTALATQDPYPVREHRAGLENYRKGNYQEAVAHFNRALEADPGYTTARLARGRTHQRRGAFELALEDFGSAQKQFDDGPTRAAIGYCFGRLGYYKEAEASFRAALDSGFTRAEVYNDLGYCLLSLSEPDAAKEALDRAIALGPNLQAPYANRALAHLRLVLSQPGYRPDQGVADIEQALKIGPPTADLLRHAAALRLQSGQDDAALEALARAVVEGEDPRVIAADPLFISLRGAERFSELVRRPPPGRAPSKAVRLLDPSPELRE